MNENFEKLGVLIDALDSLAHGLQLPLPLQMHVDLLKGILPEKVIELKDIFIQITGENPWE